MFGQKDNLSSFETNPSTLFGKNTQTNQATDNSTQAASNQATNLFGPIGITGNKPDGFLNQASSLFGPRGSKPIQVGQAGGNLFGAKNNDDLSCFNCSKLFSKAEDRLGEKATFFTEIRDGYFLPSAIPGWVRGYCRTCWEREVLAMPFIQEIKKQSKDRVAPNEQLLQEKDKEIEELKSKIKDIPPSYEIVDTLKNILAVLDEEQISVFKQNKLDAESIRENIQNEIAIMVRPLLEEKINLLSQLFDKLIIQSGNNIQQLEKAQQYIVNGLGDTSGLFTEEDILETLKPIQKKKEKQEALKEKWINLKEEVSVLNNVNKETKQ